MARICTDERTEILTVRTAERAIARMQTNSREMDRSDFRIRLCDSSVFSVSGFGFQLVLLSPFVGALLWATGTRPVSAGVVHG